MGAGAPCASCWSLCLPSLTGFIPPAAPSRSHKPQLRRDPGEAAFTPHQEERGAAAEARAQQQLGRAGCGPPECGRAAGLHQQHGAQAPEQCQGGQAGTAQAEEEGEAGQREGLLCATSCCAGWGQRVGGRPVQILEGQAKPAPCRAFSHFILLGSVSFTAPQLHGGLPRTSVHTEGTQSAWGGQTALLNTMGL